jgi:DNA-damage-inducible protein J
MSADAVVRARIDETIKAEATIVLASMGLTVSDAFRMLLVRIAKEKALPFDVRVPNATTISAMKEARAITKPRFTSLDEMIADLENAKR